MTDSEERLTVAVAREQAKALIQGFRARDLNAVRRLQIALPELSMTNHVFVAELKLSDARRAIAIEHGFDDWKQLVAACSGAVDE